MKMLQEIQLPDLLRSKTVWAGLIGYAVVLLVAAIPELETDQDMLIDLATKITFAIMGKFILFDTASKIKGEASKYDNTPQKLDPN